jgi:hypothetical protein
MFLVLLAVLWSMPLQTAGQDWTWYDSIGLGACKNIAVLSLHVGGTSRSLTIQSHAESFVAIDTQLSGTFTYAPSSMISSTAHPTAISCRAATAQTVQKVVTQLPCTSTVDMVLTDPLTLTPGVYCVIDQTSTALARRLILDGQGNPNAVFIFNVTGRHESTVRTYITSEISLIGGITPNRILWIMNMYHLSVTPPLEKAHPGIMIVLNTHQLSANGRFNGQLLSMRTTTGSESVIRPLTNSIIDWFSSITSSTGMAASSTGSAFLLGSSTASQSSSGLESSTAGESSTGPGSSSGFDSSTGSESSTGSDSESSSAVDSSASHHESSTGLFSSTAAASPADEWAWYNSIGLGPCRQFHIVTNIMDQGYSDTILTLTGSKAPSIVFETITPDFTIQPAGMVQQLQPTHPDAALCIAEFTRVSQTAPANFPCDADLDMQPTGSSTLTPGVYCILLSGSNYRNLVLDGQDDPGATFVFRYQGSGIESYMYLHSLVTLQGGITAPRILWMFENTRYFEMPNGVVPGILTFSNLGRLDIYPSMHSYGFQFLLRSDYLDEPAIRPSETMQLMWMGNEHADTIPSSTGSESSTGDYESAVSSTAVIHESSTSLAFSSSASDSSTGVQSSSGFDSSTGSESSTGIESSTAIDSSTGQDSSTGSESSTSFDSSTAAESATGLDMSSSASAVSPVDEWAWYNSIGLGPCRRVVLYTPHLTTNEGASQTVTVHGTSDSTIAAATVTNTNTYPETLTVLNPTERAQCWAAITNIVETAQANMPCTTQLDMSSDTTLSIPPGSYCVTGYWLQTSLILDGQDDPNAVFVFHITEPNSQWLVFDGTYSLVGGIIPSRILWVVHGNNIQFTRSSFYGIVASTTTGGTTLSLSDVGHTSFYGQLLVYGPTLLEQSIDFYWAGTRWIPPELPMAEWEWYNSIGLGPCRQFHGVSNYIKIDTSSTTYNLYLAGSDVPILVADSVNLPARIHPVSAHIRTRAESSECIAAFSRLRQTAADRFPCTSTIDLLAGTTRVTAGVHCVSLTDTLWYHGSLVLDGQNNTNSIIVIRITGKDLQQATQFMGQYTLEGGMTSSRVLWMSTHTSQLSFPSGLFPGIVVVADAISVDAMASTGSGDQGTQLLMEQYQAVTTQPQLTLTGQLTWTWHGIHHDPSASNDSSTGSASSTGSISFTGDSSTGFDSSTGMDSSTGEDSSTDIESSTGSAPSTEQSSSGDASMDSSTGSESSTGIYSSTAIDSSTGADSSTATESLTSDWSSTGEASTDSSTGDSSTGSSFVANETTWWVPPVHEPGASIPVPSSSDPRTQVTLLSSQNDLTEDTVVLQTQAAAELASILGYTDQTLTFTSVKIYDPKPDSAPASSRRLLQTVEGLAATVVFEVELSLSSAQILQRWMDAGGGAILKPDEYPIFSQTTQLLINVDPQMPETVVGFETGCQNGTNCRANDTCTLGLCGCPPDSSGRCVPGYFDEDSDQICVSGAPSLYADACTSVNSTLDHETYSAEHCSARGNLINLFPKRKYCQHPGSQLYHAERAMLVAVMGDPNNSTLAPLHFFTVHSPYTMAELSLPPHRDIRTGLVSFKAYVSNLYDNKAPIHNKAWALIEFRTAYTDITFQLTRLAFLDGIEGAHEFYFQANKWRYLKDVPGGAYAYWDGEAAQWECMSTHIFNPSNGRCELGCATGMMGHSCDEPLRTDCAIAAWNATSMLYLRPDCMFVQCQRDYVNVFGECILDPYAIPPPPYVDQPAAPQSSNKKKVAGLSVGAFVAVLIGSVIGAILLVFGLNRLLTRCLAKRRNKAVVSQQEMVHLSPKTDPPARRTRFGQSYGKSY